MDRQENQPQKIRTKKPVEGNDKVALDEGWKRRRT